MKRKVLGVILAMTLCFGMAVPAMAGGEEAPTYPYLGVTINDETEYHDILLDASGTGWTWTAATATLVLDSFTGDSFTFGGASKYGASVYLELKGKTTLKNSFSLNGLIYFSMTISGSGTLNMGKTLPFLSYLDNSYIINGGYVTITSNVNQHMNDITINGGTLEIENNSNTGFYAISINDGYKLFLNGGTLIVRNAETAPQNAISHVGASGSNPVAGDWSAFDKNGTDISDDLDTLFYIHAKTKLHYIKFTSKQTVPVDTQPPVPTVPDTDLTAAPTSSTVLVNGANVSFDAYNINDNNYFKLRDLAYILSGTEKQFEVTWDSEKSAINLVRGNPYTAVGGEMEGKGEGEKNPVLNASKIYLDGVEVELTAYTIEDNNYFKLRDVGETFDFGVEWDGANNTIVIDTSKGYTPG